MTSPTSRQRANDAPADALGTQRYEYRYPALDKLLVVGIILMIPFATAGFASQALQPGSLNDRLLPAIMALIMIGAGLYLAYRQASFAWTVITIHEQGMRVKSWHKHLIIPWNTIGKLYTGSGRLKRWQLEDQDGRILYELRPGAAGRVLSESDQPNIEAPALTDAVIEQAHLRLYETPFRHYAPAPKGTRKQKKAR
jgi:hypothetical protein